MRISDNSCIFRFCLCKVGLYYCLFTVIRAAQILISELTRITHYCEFTIRVVKIHFCESVQTVCFSESIRNSDSIIYLCLKSLDNLCYYINILKCCHLFNNRLKCCFNILNVLVKKYIIINMIFN